MKVHAYDFLTMLLVFLTGGVVGWLLDWRVFSAAGAAFILTLSIYAIERRQDGPTSTRRKHR